MGEGAEEHKRRYDRLGMAAVLTGLLVSMYGLYVEWMIDKHGSGYQPLCDVNEVVSCSTTMHSPFGTGLGLVQSLLGAQHFLNQKNALYGVVMYMLLTPLQTLSSRWAVSVVLAICGFLNLLTIYFVFVLVHLRTICIVCFTIYLINALLLYVNLMRSRIYARLLPKKIA